MKLDDFVLEVAAVRYPANLDRQMSFAIHLQLELEAFITRFHFEHEDKKTVLGAYLLCHYTLHAC